MAEHVSSGSLGFAGQKTWEQRAAREAGVTCVWLSVLTRSPSNQGERTLCRKHCRGPGGKAPGQSTHVRPAGASGSRSQGRSSGRPGSQGKAHRDLFKQRERESASSTPVAGQAGQAGGGASREDADEAALVTPAPVLTCPLLEALHTRPGKLRLTVRTLPAMN